MRNWRCWLVETGLPGLKVGFTPFDPSTAGVHVGNAEAPAAYTEVTEVVSTVCLQPRSASISNLYALLANIRDTLNKLYSQY